MPPLRSPAAVPSLPSEPDNEAHMRSSSRPCSPAHHHEGHAKLAGSPPRSSPVRMGPSYVLKKGWQDWAGRGSAGHPPVQLGLGTQGV